MNKCVNMPCSMVVVALSLSLFVFGTFCIFFLISSGREGKGCYLEISGGCVDYFRAIGPVSSIYCLGIACVLSVVSFSKKCLSPISPTHCIKFSFLV